MPRLSTTCPWSFYRWLTCSNQTLKLKLIDLRGFFFSPYLDVLVSFCKFSENPCLPYFPKIRIFHYFDLFGLYRGELCWTLLAIWSWRMNTLKLFTNLDMTSRLLLSKCEAFLAYNILCLIFLFFSGDHVASNRVCLTYGHFRFHGTKR